jgi:Pumilio-family RNA binding repeat
MKQVTNSASTSHANLPNLPGKPSTNHLSIQETAVTLHQPSCVRLESKSPFICKGGCGEQGWTKQHLDHRQDNLRFNISTCKAPVDISKPGERLLKAPHKYKSSLRSKFFGDFGGAPDCFELLYDIGQGRTVSRTNVILLEFMSKMHMHCREVARTDSDRKVDRVLNNEFNLLRENPPPQLLRYIERFYQQDWTQVSLEHFFYIVAQDKQQSTAFQIFMLNLEQLPSDIAQLFSRLIPEIIKDKIGCHALKRAITKSPSLMRAVRRRSFEDLFRLSCNQYASRVLQSLAALDSCFREEYIKLFNQRWKTLSNHISAIFLLSVCLKATPKDNVDLLRLGRSMQESFSIVNQVKNYKRLLVTVLEYCNEEDLQQFYHLSNLDSDFVKRMDDKYMVYIFSVFLAREYEPARRCLIGNIRTSLIELLCKSKYFKYLLQRIYDNDDLRSIQKHLDYQIMRYCLIRNFNSSKSASAIAYVSQLVLTSVATSQRDYHH